MDHAALSTLLDELIATWENEVIEFKQAGNDYDTDKIGEYFSALSNEANLRGVDRAWLVFGVNNKTRTVSGTDYRPQPERLQSLKNQIADDTEPSITLRNIHVLQHDAGQATRAEINQLLLGKLSDALTEEQKDDKVGNLLTKLRRRGRIRNTGSRGSPVWQLAE